MSSIPNQMSSKYILKVGQPASLRLDMLQELHGKYSQQFISKANLVAGTRILDIGCGTGNMSCWFAQQFPDSYIVGLDNSAAQLALATERANQKQLSNLEFIDGDLGDLTNLDQKFELIYSRYSLIHVNNPTQTLKKLKNKLAINGRIILEEPTMNTAFCYPSNIAYRKSRVLLSRLAQLRGFDFEIGKKLECMLHKLGFAIQHRNLVQPLLETTDEKKLLVMLVEECSEAYLTHGLISKDDLSRMMSDLAAMLHLPGVLIGFPRTTQLCAIREN